MGVSEVILASTVVWVVTALVLYPPRMTERADFGALIRLLARVPFANLATNSVWTYTLLDSNPQPCCAGPK